jgi:hypothetical protein
VGSEQRTAKTRNRLIKPAARAKKAAIYAKNPERQRRCALRTSAKQAKTPHSVEGAQLDLRFLRYLLFKNCPVRVLHGAPPARHTPKTASASEGAQKRTYWKQRKPPCCVEGAQLDNKTRNWSEALTPKPEDLSPSSFRLPKIDSQRSAPPARLLRPNL